MAAPEPDGVMSETLLSRLASYSQNPAKKSLENFTTEVLAYLINNDKAFLGSFIRTIIPDGRMRRRFKCASALSQQSFGKGIVDLVLSSGDSGLLVEVKIAARETETEIDGRGWVPQVQKYLDLKEGPVAYLTTRAVSDPDVNAKRKKFLGHFFFEDLYDRLVSAKLTDIGKLFRQFMEENGMKSPEPFTQQELNNARQAFGFAKKCEDFLNEIRSEVEPEFRSLFHTRTGFTGGHFSPFYGSAYIHRELTRGNVKWVEIYIEPDEATLVYGVCVRVLRTGIKRLKRHLKWTEENGRLFSSHPVKSNTRGRKCAGPILRELKQLQRAMKNYSR
jgi:hypothetical protein